MSAESRTELVPADGGCRLYAAEDGTEVSVIGRNSYAEVHCHGPAEHFRSDGGCVHTDEMLAVQKVPGAVRLLPWGGAHQPGGEQTQR